MAQGMDVVGNLFAEENKNKGTKGFCVGVTKERESG